MASRLRYRRRPDKRRVGRRSDTNTRRHAPLGARRLPAPAPRGAAARRRRASGRRAPPHADPAALVAGLDPYPAYLMTPRTDVLAFNHGAAAVITDFAVHPNLLRMLLVERVPADPRWEPTARLTLARFRAEQARFAGHPEF